MRRVVELAELYLPRMKAAGSGGGFPLSEEVMLLCVQDMGGLAVEAEKEIMLGHEWDIGEAAVEEGEKCRARKAGLVSGEQLVEE